MTYDFRIAGVTLRGRRRPPLENSEPRGENFFERIGERQEAVVTIGDAAELYDRSCSCKALIRLWGGVAGGLDGGGGRKLFSLLQAAAINKMKQSVE